MSCRTRVSTPTRGPLDVRDCSTCERSAFEAGIMVCQPVLPSEGRAILKWLGTTTFGADGFPVGPTTNCPGWRPAWSE